MILRAVLASALLLVSAGALAETYSIQSELWLDGELRGSPELVVEAGKDATVETTDGDSGWRLVFRVEPPAEHEGAASGSLWLHIEAFERSEGEWHALADSLLGLPPGQTGTFSIVEDPDTDPKPDNARMYLQVDVTPVDGE